MGSNAIGCTSMPLDLANHLQYSVYLLFSSLTFISWTSDSRVTVDLLNSARLERWLVGAERDLILVARTDAKRCGGHRMRFELTFSVHWLQFSTSPSTALLLEQKSAQKPTMSFSKGEGDNDITKAPWVEVTVPTASNNTSNHDEVGPLLDQECDYRPTAEAIPCTDLQQKESFYELSEYPQAKVVAAGTAGCIFGCLIGGVVCALMAGLGSAYAAKHKGGTCVGDTARAMGDVALIVQQKAIELDRKHDVVKTTQTAAKSTLATAKSFDE